MARAHGASKRRRSSFKSQQHRWQNLESLEVLRMLLLRRWHVTGQADACSDNCLMEQQQGMGTLELETVCVNLQAWVTCTDGQMKLL